MRHFALFIATTTALMTSQSANAKSFAGNWELKSSELTYHIAYVLKKFTGTSQQAKGKGRCDSKICEFLIGIPVKSFDSGDSNRDAHMLETTKGALHPMIVVKVELPSELGASAQVSKAHVEFAGQSQDYDHLAIKVEEQTDLVTVTGQLPLVLTAYKIELPTLLGVPIKDQAPVDFKLTWAREKQ